MKRVQIWLRVDQILTLLDILTFMAGRLDPETIGKADIERIGCAIAFRQVKDIEGILLAIFRKEQIRAKETRQ